MPETKIDFPLNRDTALRFLESDLTAVLPGGYYPSQTVGMLIAQAEGEPAAREFETARRTRIRQLVIDYIERGLPEGLATPVERHRISNYVDRLLVEWSAV